MENVFAEMTIAEKFVAIAEVVEDAEMKEFLVGRADMLKNRKSTPRKADPAVAERKAAVKAYLTATPVLAKDVAEALDMTPGQARAALTALVKEGAAKAVAGEKSKAPKTYTVA